MKDENSIIIESLRMVKNNKLILNNINLNFQKGELISFLGPSGCGKTSLLRAISGLDLDCEGKIKIFNNDFLTKNLKVEASKRKIGMVFQDFSLFPHLNILENVLIASENQSPKYSRKQREYRALELLKLVQIDHLKLSFPETLSGGQMQRVAIARALAQDANLLLMDEPFSNLDIELRHQLTKEVKALLKNLGLTAILVTHDQAEAFSFADKIAILNNGHIEQFSSSYEIYHKPNSKFVAQFIGEGKIVKGNLLSPFIHKPLHFDDLILLRPDDIVFDDHSSLKVKIISKEFRGPQFLYEIEFENGLTALTLVSSHLFHQIGEKIGIRLKMNHYIQFN